MLDEFKKGIPAHLTFSQRCKLSREHQFYENMRALLIIAVLFGAMLIAGGFE